MPDELMQLLSPPASPAGVPTQLRLKVEAYLRASKSESTRRKYEQALKDFVAWCDKFGCEPFPADSVTVASYVAALADRKKASTIGVALSAIAYAHELGGYPNPCDDPSVRNLRKGAANTHPELSEEEQAGPLDYAEVRQMLDALAGDELPKVRDRTILVVGIAAGLRRSEIAGLLRSDVFPSPWSVQLRLRRTKHRVGPVRQAIHRGQHPETCPHAVLEHWADITSVVESPGGVVESRGDDAPLFPRLRHGRIVPGAMSAKQVDRAVRNAASLIGLDVERRRLSAHSLRATTATMAYLSGVDLLAISRHLRHKSVDTTANYVRHIEAARVNIAAAIGF